MKKKEMGRSYNSFLLTMLRNGDVFVKNLKGRNYLGNLDRDDRIVLQLILQEYDVSGLDSSGSE
jgi:hypothetical protein